MPLGEELENLWNYPLADIKTKNFYTLIANKFKKKFHLWHLIRCIISIMYCEYGLVIYTIKRRHGITCIHILNIRPKIHKVGFKQKLISLIIFIIIKHIMYGPDIVLLNMLCLLQCSYHLFFNLFGGIASGNCDRLFSNQCFELDHMRSHNVWICQTDNYICVYDLVL